MKKGKTVICINTGKTYKSVQECANALNLNPDCVYAVCGGKQTIHKGLLFCYMERATENVPQLLSSIKYHSQQEQAHKIAIAEAKMREAEAIYTEALAKYEALKNGYHN